MKKFSAIEKCRAVLIIWAEKRKGLEICKEMGVSWGLLNQWQEVAMTGMLTALEPKWQEAGQCPALGRKLKQLLDRKVAEMEGRCPRLAKRLASLQEERAGK